MIVVAVAILVGVFFVATGRGGELAYEHADHAPLDLGPVSAADVALLRPPTALWGYNLQVTDAALERAARLCMALGTDGLRGELTLMRAARALAALESAKTVADDHLRRIAPPALRHRLRRNPLDDAGSSVRVDRAIAEIFG